MPKPTHKPDDKAKRSEAAKRADKRRAERVKTDPEFAAHRRATQRAWRERQPREWFERETARSRGARAWAEAILRRNTALLVDGHRDSTGALATGRQATRVFACWDGRESGGTWDTVRKARERGIEVVVAGGGR